MSTMEGGKSILVILALGLVIILVTALIFGMMLLFGTWTYVFGTFTNGLTHIPSPNNVTNVSHYAEITFGNLNSSFQTLRWWSIIIYFGLFFGILISAFLVRQSPIYFVFFFILLLVAFVISIFMSNAYEQVYTSGSALGNELQTAYVSSSWMTLYMPEIIVVFGFIGLVILFVSYSYGKDDLGGVF